MELSIGSVAFFTGVLAATGYLLYRRLRLWYIVSKFPGPPALPIIGNIHQLSPDPPVFFKQLAQWADEYRHHGGILRGWLGPIPIINIYNADDVENVLTKSKDHDKGLFYTFLVPWLGDGLLLSKGNKWFKRRKLITPSFHFSILEAFMDVFNEHALTLCKRLDAIGGKSVNIFPMITTYALDVICDTAMGKYIGAQEGKNAEYVQAVLGMCRILQDRQRAPWLWFDPLYFRLQSGKKHQEYVSVLHRMTSSVIRERLAERSKTTNGVKTSHRRGKRLAFLDLLLDAQENNPSFDFEGIKEEVDTFMFEGHDTTASSISWALFNLGLYPNIQKRVHDELDEVFGPDRNRPVTSEDCQKLQYLQCVIKETLRLFPSVPLISRELQEDAYIHGRFVPKKTVVVIGIYWLHRDPKHFPNPHEFDPDRFLPENAVGRHPFAFVPFSAGPRNCIGQKFAMMEEKTVLANLLRHFRVESLQTLEEVVPTGEIILRPCHGIEMKFIERH